MRTEATFLIRNHQTKGRPSLNLHRGALLRGRERGAARRAGYVFRRKGVR